MRTLSLFIAIFMAVTLVGCGGAKLKTIEVSGTVTFDGAPLAGAQVNFSPKTEGEGLPGYGYTDASGKYKLQTMQGEADAGTTPGEYLVTILKFEPQETPPEVEGKPSVQLPPPKSLIPVRYNRAETSGLTATVSKDSTTFDFQLTK